MPRFLPQPFSPLLNDGKHVFVFGSNLAGRHGAGAALEAKKHWGALLGHGFGMLNQSYAIPTKNHNLKTLPLDRIQWHINNFLRNIRNLNHITFLITPIGTGFAGYQHSDIAPMFKGAPENCVFCEEWREWLEERAMIS